MMQHMAILAAMCCMLLTDCAVHCEGKALPPPITEPPTGPFPVKPVPSVPRKNATHEETPSDVDSLTPPQVITEATVALDQAVGYVAWKSSRADNIDQLTVLARDLDISITQMRLHGVNDKYPKIDVIKARMALHALKVFLATKGD